MDPARAADAVPKAVVFQDGLGERRRASDVSGAETIEQLCIRSDLTAIPSFEFALRERASRLASFRHVYYGRVRSIDRLNDASSTLAVVSDSIKGVRLANLLGATERRPITLDLNASLHLLRQLVSALAMLHENARDVAHGALGPERIIITPNARVVIVEYVLGAALEQLRYSRERYWRELRIALPSSSTRFDHRADVTQLGVVALSLVIGRLLHEDEYPDGIADVLELASAITPNGEHKPLPHALRNWIGRALQLEPRHSFASALEARDELDRVLSGEDEDDEEEETGAPASEPTASVEPEPKPAAKIEPPYQPRVESKAEAKFDPKYEPKVESTVERRLDPGFGPKFEARAEFPSDAKVDEVVQLKSGWKVEPKVESKIEPKLEPAIESKVDAKVVGTKHEPRPEPKAEPRPAPKFEPKPVAAQIPSAAEPEPEFSRDDVDNHHEPWRVSPRIAAAAAAVIVLSTAGIFAGKKFFTTPASAMTGTLNLQSNPPGAQILVDGQPSGVTPIALTLKPGNHNVELRGTGEPRVLPINIVAGAQVSQYVDLPKEPTAFGQLQVRSEPAGAQVTVDGIPRGKAPVLVESLAAGDHVVVLDNGSGPIKHTVPVEAGTTAALVVPMSADSAAAAPPSGWITVAAPVELQVLENKRLIGTSLNDKLMVGAGKHEIEFVNEPLGYRALRSVQVAAGKVTPLKLEWPKGTISINALPWAEVWIDGERVGETPIGNLQVPIGPHELTFRHPDHAEQRYAATVSLKESVRVSIDLTKK